MTIRPILIVLLFALPRLIFAQDQARDDVSLDFQDVDIKVVITAIAEAGKLNVSYGPLPPRVVTLRTSQPIPRSGMRALLKSLTESNGLMLVEEGPVIRIVPIPETPRVTEALAISRAAEPATGPQDPILHIYRLRHARAPRIANTIQALFGGSTSYIAESQLSQTSLSQQLRSQQIPPSYSQPMQPAAVTGGQSGRSQADLQIVADESTNSLLVRASPADWSRVRQAIDSLDVRPLQVLIEVLIAEVRRTNDQSLGVALGIPETESRSLRGRIGGTIGEETTGDVVLRLLDVGAIDARIVLSALASRADVSILSRPVILAHNNAEARILIGSQRPFVQVVRALPTESAVRDQIIQYREVGTSLRLIPTINPDGYVTLELVQEVSAATNETQFGAPVISTREASTQMLVKDGQTAVIGGLIDRQTEDIRTGVPVLKDIPILGRLFGSTRRNRFNTELFLFITPRVVKTDEDVDVIREGIKQNSDLLKKPLRDVVPLLPADTTTKAIR